jgi:cellulase/cellobiase CelA1/uncharacterized protein YjdB/aryl-phospho-beta-D-glucosidase BglC (GH1 family)
MREKKMRKFKVLMSIIVLLMLFLPWALTDTFAADSSDDYLSANGGALYDDAGNPVRLTGIAWFGFETSNQVYHGLWSADMEDILDTVANRGFNLLRIPLCVQLVNQWRNGSGGTPSSVNYSANPSLEGMTSLQILDASIAYCKKIGLKVMLDMHRVVNTQMLAAWYTDGYPPSDFEACWQWLARRYANDDTVIAMDLFNEPHGKPGDPEMVKWDDSTDLNNWKYEAEKVANIVLDVNPELLIVVEGIEATPKDGFTYAETNSANYDFNWWGGNLRRVKDYSIDLRNRQSQLVYSPHDYGPSVHEQPWFYAGFTKASLTADCWEPNWLYIAMQDLAPVLVGEWGGKMDGGDNQKWMGFLADTIAQYDLNHTFWCVNPNSGDTGGILLDDWQSVDTAKYNLVEPTLWKDADGKFVGLDHQVNLGANGTHVGAATIPDDDEDGDDGKEVPVTGLTASPTQLAIDGGGTGQLTATVTPADATNKTVNWRSSNTAIATVSASGLVTAVANGTVTITATTQDQGYTATCTVTVTGMDGPTATPCDSPVGASLPLVINGAGDFCRVTSGDISHINSWNVQLVEINGRAYTNTWSNKMPDRINGNYYIHYVGKYPWSHLGINGSGGESSETVPVTGVSVTPASTSVNEGSITTLTATVAPRNATNKSITWASSDSRVATVSSEGVVTGIAAGSATITVTTQDGSHTATCAVTVTRSGDAISTPCASPVAATLPLVINGAGEFCRVTSGSITYINSWNMQLVEINGVAYTNTWSNKMPARINGNYYIHYVGRYPWSHLEVNGTGGSSQTVSVTGVTVSPASTSVVVGASTTLTATVSPGNATNKRVARTSSDTRVARVNSAGVVTGVSAGSAIITVTTADGGFTAVSDITVSEATGNYTLTIKASGNGSTHPAIGSHTYAAGSSVSVSATPSSGATFTGWSGAATGTANPITVTMDADKILTANFSGGDDDPDPPPTTHVDNPFAGADSYINPDYTAKVLAEAQSTGGTLGAGMAKVADYSTAIWLDRIAAIEGSADAMGLRAHLDEALRQQNGDTPRTIMLVIYDLPNRDCSAAASNGELLIAEDGMNIYKTQYIDPIAAILSDPKYSSLRIVTVVEPDSLPNLVTNLDIAACAEADSSGAYVDGIRYAIDQLHPIENVYIYLDIAHSAWLGWDNNFAPAVQLYTRLLQGAAAGVNSVDGFITNTANYTPIEEVYLPDANLNVGGQPLKSSDFYEWNPYFDEKDYATALRTAFINAGLPGTIGMLIDTSRNGWGGSQRPDGVSNATDLNTYVDQSRVDRRPHRGGWCNQQGAGIGARPRAAPAVGIDAYVWVKPPGESDGVSSAGVVDPDDPNKQFDVMCDPKAQSRYNAAYPTNAMPDAPHAGRWFAEQFRMLVENADPPLVGDSQSVSTADEQLELIMDNTLVRQFSTPLSDLIVQSGQRFAGNGILPTASF